MGCVLYPPVSLVAPLHRVQRRRTSRTTQHVPPPSLTPLCISTLRVSSWHWPVLTQYSQHANEDIDVNTEQDLPTAARAVTTTATNEKGIHHHKSYYHYRKKNKDGKMEQRLIALPSIALSVSVLALGVAIGSGSCMGSRTSGALSAIFGRSVGLGFGLNLSTFVPFLTLAWHAFSVLSCSPAPATASRDYYYRPLSGLDPSSAVTGDDHRLPPTAMRTRTRARVWVPRSLALLWFLNTLLVLLVPRWSSAVAFSYAGLALLSALEAGVLALSGMVAQCQIQRELAGETDDDECGWEISDVADDDDDRKLGERLPA
jgi:hypothetical protein